MLFQTHELFSHNTFGTTEVQCHVNTIRPSTYPSVKGFNTQQTNSILCVYIMVSTKYALYSPWIWSLLYRADQDTILTLFSIAALCKLKKSDKYHFGMWVILDRTPLGTFYLLGKALNRNAVLSKSSIIEATFSYCESLQYRLATPMPILFSIFSM